MWIITAWQRVPPEVCEGI